MYTIQLLHGDSHRLERFREALIRRLQNDGRFRVGDMTIGTTNIKPKEAREAGVVNRFNVPTLFLQRIRLVSKKPYCGNHPGPCIVNPFLGETKKPNSTYLEWDDWVAFHNLVNGMLSQRKMMANVWTLPQDVNGKMWIRKGYCPRYRWDYHEEDWGRTVPVRIWNQGTPDQFEK